jgi:hypothetical protein
MNVSAFRRALRGGHVIEPRMGYRKRSGKDDRRSGAARMPRRERSGGEDYARSCARSIEPDERLAIECEVLVPAAKEIEPLLPVLTLRPAGADVTSGMTTRAKVRAVRILQSFGFSVPQPAR